MYSPEKIVTELAGYAPKYQEEVFNKVADDLGVNRNELLDTDPRTALKFFYRLYGFNRSGAMKAGYHHRAVEALEKTGSETSIDSQMLWRQFERECERNDTGAYRRRNQGLLEETSRFVNRKGNLFRWVARELGNNVQLQTLSEELESLHGIGPGKARFFIRDAVWLCEAEETISDRDRYRLQAMTGPIKAVARALWPNLESVEEMAKRIDETCANAGVSGIEFNQGAWYFQDRVSEDLDAL